MKVQIFLSISVWFFSLTAFSMGLGELAATTAVQNTLNSAAQFSSGKYIDQVRKAVKQDKKEKQTNQEKLKEYPKVIKQSQSGDDNISLEDLSSDELDKKFDDGEVEISADGIDYTSNAVIFYKSDCLNGARTPSQTCTSTPVLTNIKSVIFNYVRRRGEFKKKSN